MAVVSSDGSKRAPRPTTTDIADVAARKFLDDHVMAADTPLTLWMYTKGEKQGAAWNVLFKNKLALYDLISLTRGMLLRAKRFEFQMQTWMTDKQKTCFDSDQISLTAKRRTNQNRYLEAKTDSPR